MAAPLLQEIGIYTIIWIAVRRSSLQLTLWTLGHNFLQDESDWK